MGMGMGMGMGALAMLSYIVRYINVGIERKVYITNFEGKELLLVVVSF